MRSKYALCLDPSGNYNEGKGTTGWVLMDLETKKVIKFGVLKAAAASSQMDYWDKHIELIEGLSAYKPVVVAEDYLLYADKAEAQINSRLETPQLLGIIQYECWKRNIDIHMQPAVRVKTRWSEKILVHKGYLTVRGRKYLLNNHTVVGHIRDALKHGIHYATFVYPKLKEEVLSYDQKREGFVRT